MISQKEVYIFIFQICNYMARKIKIADEIVNQLTYNCDIILGSQCSFDPREASMSEVMFPIIKYPKGR